MPNQDHRLKKPLLANEQLYFIHVPKCAGTSFISLVDERYVIDEIVPTHYDLKMLEERITNAQLASYRFIRGHFPYDMIVPRLPSQPRIITFLREPIVRLVSNFQMRQRVSDPLQGMQKMLQSLTLDEFLARQDLMDIFSNRATRLIGGNTRNSAGMEIPNLELAKERIAAFDFVGIVESYNDSLALFSYIFDFPSMQSDRILNVSPDREKRNEISQSTLARVAETEWADIELYKFGHELFDTQFARMQKEQADGIQYPQPQKVASVQFDFSLVDPGMGWHVAERHPQFGVIRWSGSETASHLRFPLHADREILLQFDILQAVAPDILESLTLKVNGEPIPLKKSDVGVGGQVGFEAHIPARVLRASGGAAVFTFEVNRTVSPMEIDAQSTDARLLGLCYHSLSLIPA